MSNNDWDKINTKLLIKMRKELQKSYKDDYVDGRSNAFDEDLDFLFRPNPIKDDSFSLPGELDLWVINDKCDDYTHHVIYRTFDSLDEGDGFLDEDIFTKGPCIARRWDDEEYKFLLSLDDPNFLNHFIKEARVEVATGRKFICDVLNHRI